MELTKFSLKHKHRTPRRILHAQNLEDQGRADLVGCIADKDVVGRELGQLDDIADNNFEFLGEVCSLYALGNFGGHARVEFDCSLLATPLGSGEKRRTGCDMFGLLQSSYCDVP